MNIIRELEKVVGQEGDGNPVVTESEKETGWSEDQKKNQDHSD